MSLGTTDTIAAISTPPGEGGVGMVRLSGPEALSIAARAFRSSKEKDILAARRQRVFHGHIHDEAGRSVDEVLLHVMRAPRSYTAEDVVEITGHGGAAPMQAILEILLHHGARLAQPGEFTKRAFLNGRIDLSQAEAVIDQIQARTAAALRAANDLAGGALSRALKPLRDTLADTLAHVEAAVDFPEEDLPELVTPALFERLAETRRDMLRLLDTAQAGRLYREGALVAIAGKPNVGKSSLFNALLRDTRAIVTAQPGTTRDRIEECANLGGAPVRLVDTAGIRSTDDEVERIGVDRAREALQSADLVLFVVDASLPLTEEDRQLAENLAGQGMPVLAVLNKMDVAAGGAAPAPLPDAFHGPCPISALTGQGLDVLEECMTELLLGPARITPGQPLLSRVHQADSLRRAATAVDHVLANRSVSPELLAFDLREAIDALGEITGETTPEDILDRIFSSFCIGK